MNKTLDATTLQLLAPLIAIQLILVIFALIVLVRAERTRGPKWVWTLVIILGNLAGPILFFLFGRRND